VETSSESFGRDSFPQLAKECLQPHGKAYAADLLSASPVRNLRILLCYRVFRDFHINEIQDVFIMVIAPLDLLQTINK